MAASSLGEDEPTPATKNPCGWCGTRATPILNIPFPGEQQLRQPAFRATCVIAPTWRWCAVREEYAGRLWDRRRA